MLSIPDTLAQIGGLAFHSVVDFLGGNWSAALQIGHVSLVGRLEESDNIDTHCIWLAPRLEAASSTFQRRAFLSP